ncbi:hypothetical protein Q4574_10970 [Aliiglaciecola sp. 3_MG-2023]|uniref:hypothetical protein n=1 Tax=Aliiglaciecola sp. 3_MG-2023 TaxID=3062644 RepID=UPI0026E30201|nr:hypothetical protein [Aliiglaciecola sp. 3_MG-2023]MDO6693811.1 hypothetical protein [Aliiglaciecola sp. 3_MG-2023]
MKNFAGCILFLLCSWSSNASIIGTQVVCDIEPSIIWECDDKIAIADANNSEFDLLLMGTPFLSVNFEKDALLISNLQDNLSMGANEMLSLSFAPNLFSPSDFALLTSVEGFDAVDIDFNQELLALNFNNTRWSSEDYILLSFQSSASAVSNAPSLLLLIIGLVALKRRLAKNTPQFKSNV